VILEERGTILEGAVLEEILPGILGNSRLLA
jgi:hypothetical protein